MKLKIVLDNNESIIYDTEINNYANMGELAKDLKNDFLKGWLYFTDLQGRDHCVNMNHIVEIKDV